VTDAGRRGWAGDLRRVLSDGGDEAEQPDFEGAAAVRHGGRPGVRAAAVFRRSAGDGERRGRCGLPSWSLRRRRLAPVATSSGGTTRRSLAAMAAAALCRGRRDAQARKQQGGVLWARSTGDRAVPGSDAEGWRQRDAPGLRRVRV
jgi:hypothetical protein